MRGHLKFMYKTPNEITQNWTMQSQTMACIVKSQHTVAVRYLHFGTTYQSIFKGQDIQNREYSTTKFNWHDLQFLELCPLCNFL